MDTFKILSIDGGGIKGLYSSTILEELESTYKCNMSDHFDMICGTSTGGLIALGLSLKIPAKDISNLYIKQGAKIFPSRALVNTFKQIMWKGKFSNKPLISAVTEIFGDKVLGDSYNLLCIPSYSITDNRPYIFKHNHSDLTRDNNTRYVDVALATSAAPTYLPIWSIESHHRKQFIDGGVWANNPTLVGLLEALQYFVGKDKPYKRIELLSISSLNITGGKPLDYKKQKSFISWGADLFETFNIGQAFFTDFFMQKMNHFHDVDITYVRIPSVEISAQQKKYAQMDNATKDSIDFIRGKGKDQALIYSKRDDVKSFFKKKKNYQTINNNKTV